MSEGSQFGLHGSEYKTVVRPLAERLRRDGPKLDWAQLEAGTFRVRDPLDLECGLIPMRLDDICKAVVAALLAEDPTPHSPGTHA